VTKLKRGEPHWRCSLKKNRKRFQLAKEETSNTQGNNDITLPVKGVCTGKKVLLVPEDAKDSNTLRMKRTRGV